MRKYYPVLSVAVALLFLLLPVVILISSSGRDEPSESKDESAGVSQTDILQLKEQVALLSSKVPELERTVNELRKSNNSTNDLKPAIAKATEARADLEEANHGKPALPADRHFQRIEERVEDLNRQLAGFMTSHKSPDAGRPARPEDPKNVEATPPKLVVADAAPVSVADETVTFLEPRKKVADRTPAMPSPRPAMMLTPSELSKQAKENLRERAELEPSVEEAIPEEAIPEEAIPEEVVEILLQTPKDGMTVNRVEQLYAQSRAPGWPVVLVRSSFDDEEWWAQPISGRSGTQITARVHFGNDATPRGSAFSMVILLLDGYEEAVRFRTARRFKDIPKGVRKSPVYMYVLK